MRCYLTFLALLPIALCSCQTQTAEVVPVPERAHGILTHCSHGGEPITVGERTAACCCGGRVYYFGGEAGRAAFMKDPAAGIAKLPANMIPREVEPHKRDIGVRARCARGEKVFTIAADTPALYYDRRIYYFRGPHGRAAFKADPQYHVARDPANRLPRRISPPEKDIGKKVRCAHGGEELTVTKDTPALLHAEKVYYFGGPKGMSAFREDPQGFILREHKQ